MAGFTTAPSFGHPDLKTFWNNAVENGVLKYPLKKFFNELHYWQSGSDVNKHNKQQANEILAAANRNLKHFIKADPKAADLYRKTQAMFAIVTYDCKSGDTWHNKDVAEMCAEALETLNADTSDSYVVTQEPLFGDVNIIYRISMLTYTGGGLK